MSQTRACTVTGLLQHHADEVCIVHAGGAIASVREHALVPAQGRPGQAPKHTTNWKRFTGTGNPGPGKARTETRVVTRLYPKRWGLKLGPGFGRLRSIWGLSRIQTSGMDAMMRLDPTQKDDRNLAESSANALRVRRGRTHW